MYSIEVENFAEAYNTLRPMLLNAPMISPRGMLTKEITYVHIEIKNSRSRIAYHPERKMSLPFIVAESCLLFDQTNKLEYIQYYNNRMKTWSDDGKTLYGSYGKRIASSIVPFLLKLKNDNTTRQAVLSIYENNDIITQTKDTPCTLVIQGMIRNNKLDMHVTMRSNDFIWGFFNDIPMFTFFQEICANAIGVEVGRYIHSIDSLHIYEQHFGLLEIIENMQPFELSVPYVLEDISDLLYYIKNPKTCDLYELEQDIKFSKYNHPFGSILLYFLKKKRKIEPNEIHKSISWATKFLEDRK